MILDPKKQLRMEIKRIFACRHRSSLIHCSFVFRHGWLDVSIAPRGNSGIGWYRAAQIIKPPVHNLSQRCFADRCLHGRLCIQISCLKV